ncbi:MAG TPA: SDR family NAD(P)-dependent oxidoreductase [Steroidobacteraceae bacterium]|nr:SDR family NAD(P)-dependent oxidoreductase [Steroidobacteraceae bacterium]
MKIGELFKVEGLGVIVTGGASGLGLGYAEALAENGARVTILDVDADRVDQETRRMRDLGWAVRGDVVDVRDHPAIDRAFDAAAMAHGRLDVVFANAGVDPGPGFVGSWMGSQRPRNSQGALENYTDERWNRVLDINLNGIFATLRAGARLMRPQRAGRMIVTTSVAAYQCEPAIGAAYMTAKAGAAHLMRQVALELAAFGITVNAIAPGFFATNIGGGHAKQPQVQEAMGKVIPMHRVGFAEDMHGLALFLASPASAYLTGQQISIDGGWTLGVAD